MKLKLIALAVIIITALNSCKKDFTKENDDLESTALIKKFFSSTKPLPPEIEAIKKQLELENIKYNFVPKIIELAGMPKWEKVLKVIKNDVTTNSVVNNSTSTSYDFIIPTVGTANEMVMGAITVQPNNAVPYHLVLLNDFAQHGAQKEQFLFEMMTLNNRVFGNEKFKILNNSICNTSQVFFDSSTNSQLNGGSNNIHGSSGCHLYEVWFNPNDDFCACDGDEYTNGATVWLGPDCVQQTTSVILPSGGSGSTNSSLPPYYYPIVGLPGGGGNTNPPPYYPVLTTQQKTDYLITELNLTLAQQSSLLLVEGGINTLYDYLFAQNTLRRRNIAIWSIQYLSSHPNINMPIFKNQFLGKSEGFDDDFEEQFWEDNTNNFPPQILPSWSDFEAAYPKTNGGDMDAPDVYDLVGGTVKALRDGVLNDNDPNNDDRYENACALRMSRALNYSGITLPIISGQTFKGADNKNYFLGAANLNRWMRKTFGCANPNTAKGEFLNSNASNFNTTEIGVNGENLPTLLAGKIGIYTIVTNSSWASGHCDMLYDNSTCIGDCHFADPETIYYCDVWNLQ